MTTTKLIISPDIYDEYTHREHIYKVPDTYIGSTRPIDRVEWVLLPVDPVPGQQESLVGPFKLEARQKAIKIPVGMERLFIEVLSNAGDNAPNSRLLGINPGKIEVIMNRKTVIVKNGGKPIPIDINTKTGKLAPDMIFGSLLTSSNYHGTRIGAGRNGYGSKVSNIFSKEFTVLIGDSGREKSYRKTWKNNMTESDPSIISEGYKGDNYVIVSYNLEFERFEMTEYTDEAFGLFARLCADLAFTQKIPVSFNGQIFSFKKPNDFASIYFTKGIEHGFTLYLWPQGTKTVKKGKTYVAEDPKIEPLADIFLVDTPQDNSLLSFVNGMMTRDGGVHVNGLVKLLSKKILDALKEQMGEGPNMKKKGKSTKQSKAKTVKPGVKAERFPLTIADVKNTLSMIASFHLENPEFSSQSKTCLTAPEPYIHIEEDVLEPIYKWKIMDRLYFLLEAKNESKLSKTDGKKKRFIGPTRADECNEAGLKRANECTLMLVEGNSAMSYGYLVRDILPNGNDLLGILPLRGKMLNVMNAPAKKIGENKEILEIKKVLGLQEGMDYAIPENANKLRYGRVMLATDADVDGIHIKGLAINYMAERFRSLFKIPKGFAFELILPILRLYHGKEVYPFFSFKQYHNFLEEHPEAKKWRIQYFKGLGTSTDVEAKEDFTDPKYSWFNYDDDATRSLHLAFDKKYTDERKKWIAGYKEYDIEYSNVKTITDFINKELIIFSVDDVQRSLPKFMDGLKPGQRKILWGVFQKWKGWRNKSPDALDKVKVNNLGSFVSELTKYHHGPTSMDETIIGMAQDFVGSNNLPYLTRDGGFGTRKEGGKDACSPRYIFTRPEWWLKYVYRQEDEPLLKQIVEENESIEPETFYPIIPMSLINGENGIGTGWSTFIPNHNPLDIIEWLKMRIIKESVTNQELPEIYPWYKGFRGTLELIDRNSKKKTTVNSTLIIKEVKLHDDDIEDIDGSGEGEDEDDIDKIPNPGDDDKDGGGMDNGKDSSVDNDRKDIRKLGSSKTEEKPRLSLVTKGTYKFTQSKIYISELPIGRWTKKYENWLEDLAVNKKITNYRKTGTKDFPEFEITGFNEPDEKRLKLIKSYGMTNMVLLDNSGVPFKFNTVKQILEAFYQLRRLIYVERKRYTLENLKILIIEADFKRRFISSVVEGKLIIMKRPKIDVQKDMDILCIPRPLFDKVKASGFTTDAIDKLNDKIIKLQKEHDILEKTSPEEIWYRELDEFAQVYRNREIKKVSIKIKKK